MFDTALAVENMVLAAHALGLGTVILGYPLFFRSQRIQLAGQYHQCLNRVIVKLV